MPLSSNDEWSHETLPPVCVDFHPIVHWQYLRPHQWRPDPPIWHCRGLREGDLLSLILFMFIINVLNSLLQRAISLGILQWLTPRDMASSVSLYTDNMAIFCHPNPQDLSAIRELLQIFGTASSLATNLSKSSTTPICCCLNDIEAIRDVVQCPSIEFPIKTSSSCLDA